MARRHTEPLETVHAELHIFGRLFRAIFAEADFTQSTFHIVNIGAYMVKQATDLGISLNAASTQSGEAQHKHHRDIMLRTTQHKHNHNTLETVLATLEFYKDEQQASMNIPNLGKMIEAFRMYCEGEPSVEPKLEKGWGYGRGINIGKLEDASLTFLSSVPDINRSPEVQKLLASPELTEHSAWVLEKRSKIYLDEFVGVCCKLVGTPANCNDSLSASIISADRHANWHKHHMKECEKYPHLAYSVSKRLGQKKRKHAAEACFQAPVQAPVQEGVKGSDEEDSDGPGGLVDGWYQEEDEVDENELGGADEEDCDEPGGDKEEETEDEEEEGVGTDKEVVVSKTELMTDLTQVTSARDTANLKISCKGIEFGNTWSLGRSAPAETDGHCNTRREFHLVASMWLSFCGPWCYFPPLVESCAGGFFPTPAAFGDSLSPCPCP